MAIIDRRSLIISGASALALSITNRSIGSARASDQATLRLAIIGGDPKSAVPKVEAMASYLAENLRGAGIERWEAIVAQDNGEIIELLRSGHVDLVSQTAFSAMQYVDQAGAEILAREWKSGVSEYRTLFITDKDSPIRSVADLKGRRLAVENPDSTTAFLLPMSMLIEAGLNPKESHLSQLPDPDTINYTFSGDETNTATMVARGIADAGVISDVDWNSITRTPEPLKARLRVFAESEPLVRSLILVRGDLSADLKAAIKTALFAMHESVPGKATLEKYYKVGKYDEVPTSVVAQLDRIRRMLPKLSALTE
jgi:phosphonate transport system substrate-binding protein